MNTVNQLQVNVFSRSTVEDRIDSVVSRTTVKVEEKGTGDVDKGTNEVVTTVSRPDFVGKLKGEEVKLPNVKIEMVTFNKRNPNTL